MLKTKTHEESIAYLGETQLIQQIKSWLGSVSPPAPSGIGDDCAVLNPFKKGKQLITTDSINYGYHFNDKIAASDVGAHAMRAADISLQLDILAKVDLFRDLNLRESVAVLSTLGTRQYRPGEPVLYRGQRIDQLHLIIRGRLGVFLNGAQMGELGPGEHFGATGLFADHPYVATIEALEPVELLTMRRGDFRKLVDGDRELGAKLLWKLSESLAERLEQTATALEAKSLEARTLQDKTGSGRSHHAAGAGAPGAGAQSRRVHKGRAKTDRHRTARAQTR